MIKTYFPHDSNARNSKKLLRLRKKHGAAGYGVYFMLIERLTEEENFCSDLDYDMLAYDLHVKKDFLQSIVENFELFEIKTDELGVKKFQSAGLLERMELRGIRSEAGKKGAAARWKTSPQPTDDKISADGEAMAKDGKTMAKDEFAIGKAITKGGFANSIKEKNIININNNPFFYVFPFFLQANGKKIDLATLAYLVLERNMGHAEEELEKLTAYNDVQGRRWEDMSIDQRIAAAKLWSPRTKRSARFSKEFLSFWTIILAKATEMSAPFEIIYQMLSDNVKEGVRGGDSYYLPVTTDVMDWIEDNVTTYKPYVMELVKSYKCTRFDYSLTDKTDKYD